MKFYKSCQSKKLKVFFLGKSCIVQTLQTTKDISLLCLPSFCWSNYSLTQELFVLSATECPLLEAYCSHFHGLHPPPAICMAFHWMNNKTMTCLPRLSTRMDGDLNGTHYGHTLSRSLPHYFTWTWTCVYLQTTNGK